MPIMKKRPYMSFTSMLDASEQRQFRKAQVLNPSFETQNKVGKLMLPLSNNIPARFATITAQLPHSQIRTQDLALKSIKDHEPEVSADVKELTYIGKLLTVPVLRASSQFTASDIGKIMIPYLVPFLCSGENFPLEKYYVTAISMFASLDPNLSEGTINKALAEKDLACEFKICATAEEYWDAFSSEGDDWNIHCFSIGNELHSFSAILAFVGVMLQTFGKHVTDLSYVNWFNSRFRALSSVLNVEGPETYDNIRPTHSTLIKGYNALSTAFSLRRSLFDRMFKLKLGSSKVATMFSHVLQLLSCTDITHVLTIDTYLVKGLPELMNLPILRQYESNLLAMYEFWAKHEKIFPYVRIYVPPAECFPVHRDNLQPLIAAAFAVGSYQNESFKNYKGPVTTSKLYKDVFEQVSKYLNARMSFAPIALISSDRSAMTDIEREKMYQKFESSDMNDVYSTYAQNLDKIAREIQITEEEEERDER